MLMLFSMISSITETLKVEYRSYSQLLYQIHCVSAIDLDCNLMIRNCSALYFIINRMGRGPIDNFCQVSILQCQMEQPLEKIYFSGTHRRRNKLAAAIRFFVQNSIIFGQCIGVWIVYSRLYLHAYWIDKENMNKQQNRCRCMVLELCMTHAPMNHADARCNEQFNWQLMTLI